MEQVRPHTAFRAFLVRRYPFVVIGLCWLLAWLGVFPTGNFPVNDDWAYAQNVRHLAEEGRFTFSHWPGMTLIAQTLWGALFCKLFGFSFEVLRLSTLVLAVGCTVLLFVLVRSLTRSTAWGLLAALILLFDPFFFTLSFSFMTEAHFLFFVLAALVGIVRWANTGNDNFYWLAMLLGLVAVLVRQTGVVLVVAFGVAYLWRNGWRRFGLVTALLPATMALLALWAYKAWRTHLGSIAGSYGEVGALYDPTKAFDPLYYAIRGGHLLYLAAIMALPFLLATLGTGKRTLSRTRWAVLAAAYTIAGTALYCAWDTFPVGNVLYDLGLGPKLLKDTFWNEHMGLALGAGPWAVIKAVLIAGVAWGIYLACSRPVITETVRPERRTIQVVLVVIAAGYAAYLLVAPTFFDRYAMPLSLVCTLLLVCCVPLPTVRPARAAFAVLIGYAVLDIVLVRDHFAWDRARWQALDQLTEERGIRPNRIDGGFEFNGWHQAGPLNPTVQGERSWWFVTDDEYVVSSGPIEGFERIAGYPYHRLLPFGVDSILILHHPRERDIPIEEYPYTLDAETVTDDGRLATTCRLVAYDDMARRSDECACSGRYCIALGPGQAFALTRLFRDVRPGERFIGRMWRHVDSGRTGIVLQTNSTPAVYEGRMRPIRMDGDWVLLQVDVTIPSTIDDDVVGIYIWASDERPAWVDDLWIHRIPPEDPSTRP